MKTQHIGEKIGMLSNQIRRQVYCGGSDEMGATPMQGKILHYLLSHEEQGDVFQRDLERHFNMRRSTATGMLRLLEEHGWIVREEVPQDRRLKKLVLTEKAHASGKQIEKRIEQIEREMRRGISQQDLKTFFAVADQVRRNLQEMEERQ